MKHPTTPCRLSIHPCAGQRFLPYLRKYVPRAILIAASSLTELSIVLVNDKAIARLHADFFHDATTTDVITFPLDSNAQGKARTGELYLCVAMARRQARWRGVAVRDELLLYAIHGLLHLSGHDDRTARGYSRMHRLEDQILESLGIGPVFAAARKREALD